MQGDDAYEEGDVDRAEEGDDDLTETEGEDEGVPSPEGDTAAALAVSHVSKATEAPASRARAAPESNGHVIQRRNISGRRPHKKQCFQLYKKAISEMEKEDLLDFVTTNRQQIEEAVIDVTNEGSNVITSTHIHVEYHAGNDIRIFVPWDAISSDFHGIPNKEFWFSFTRVDNVPRLTVRRNTINVPGQHSMRLTPIATSRSLHPSLVDPTLGPSASYATASHHASTSYSAAAHHKPFAAHHFPPLPPPHHPPLGPPHLPASAPSTSSHPPPSASDPPHAAHKKARLLSESFPSLLPPRPPPANGPSRTTPLTAHPGPAGADTLKEWRTIIDGVFEMLSGRKDAVLARWRKWIMDTPQADIDSWYRSVRSLVAGSGDAAAQATFSSQVADTHDADLVAGGADGDVWRLRLQVVQRLERAVRRGSFEASQRAVLQRRAFTMPAAKIAQCREVLDAKEDTQTDWYFIWLLKE